MQMDENVKDLSHQLGDHVFKSNSGMFLVGLGCAVYVADPKRPMADLVKKVAYGQAALEKDVRFSCLFVC